jgi:hypothetical protein
MGKNAREKLEEAVEIYKQRSVVYGNNYELVGETMKGLFPDGLTLTTAHDWDRLHIFLLIIVKLTRYVKNWKEGGHADSMEDIIVYAALMGEIDGTK